MNSTAFLRRGLAPTPPLPASGLPLTSRRVWFKGGGGQSQGCKLNGLQMIRCARFSNPPPSSNYSGRSESPLANTKMALHSLLCFSSDTAAEPETINISTEKKRALTLLVGNKPGEAERIMENLLSRYQKQACPASIEYDAALALVQILIHIGTSKSLDAAIRHLNKIDEMASNECLPSDAKPTLYRAVIYTLLEENSKAREYWKFYTNAIGSGPPMG